MFDRSRHSGAAIHVRRVVPGGALLMALVVPAAAQTAAQTPGERGTDAHGAEERQWVVMGDRPSLRFGDGLRLDLTSKIGLTVRTAPDEDPDPEMEQSRIGVDGRLFEIIGF